MKRLSKTVEGVDPINFAPALLDDYNATAKHAEFSPKAWQFFMTTTRDVAPDWPLKSAWRDMRDVGRNQGWSVSSHPTFYRKWTALPETQRLQARYGSRTAAERMRQPVHRDKTSIAPLDRVSLDGRTKHFWVGFGDGRAVRATFLALADVASNMILGWELSISDNAIATGRLICEICEKYGFSIA